jgi:microcystin-dependent protein
MSIFLPDGPNQSDAPSGVADITPAEPETTSADIALMQRVLAAASRNVNLIPSDFMAYIVDFIQTSRLQIPIGQVPGYSQSIPTGVIWPLAGDSVPSGWLLCDHSAYSRSQYSSLFNEIGTVWGAGDGSTTFNVPPAGLVWVGKDGSTEFNHIGQTGGEKTHTLTQGELPNYTLPLSSGYTLHDVGTAAGYAGGGGDGVNDGPPIVSSGGGGLSHNNLQPYGVVNYIIKT